MKDIDFLAKSLTPDFLTVVTSLLFAILLALSIYYLINIGNRHIEKSRRINVDLKLLTKVLAVLILFYILRKVFDKYPIIGNTIGAIFISIIIAYVMNPVVTYMEQKGLNRKYGVLVVYITLTVLLVVLLVVVLPKTVEEMRSFFFRIPEYVESWTGGIQDWLQKIGDVTGLKTQDLQTKLTESTNKLVDSFQDQAGDKIRSIASGITSLLSKIVSFVLILIFSFYFCADKERFKLLIQRNIPGKYKTDILYLSNKINNSLLEFVKGKLLLAVFVGVSTTIMLIILRVDFAVVIGIITCIADIIPYIGPFLGLLPAVVFAAIESKFKALWVFIFFILLQWVENNIMAPKILGDKTGMHPLIVLLCIVIGGGMFGVGGMILSVPFVSVLMILKEFGVIKYRERRSHNQVD
ncbi:MAG: AI-2E family transporter [Tissierellia bacterium]|nr:AI-2E family transporter [Tissierellia bacterium]